MQIKRAPLPIRSIDQACNAMLKEYRIAAKEFSSNVSSLLGSAFSTQDGEAVLQQLEKGYSGDNMIYEPGMKVEVDIQGQWVEAVVKSFNGGCLKVERADGQVRPVMDLAKVRSDAGPMTNGIWLEKFGVRIPEGTQSYALEKALDPITERMNCTSLRVNKATYLRNLEKTSIEFETALAKCREMTQDQTFRAHATRDCLAAFQKRGHTFSSSSMDKEVLQYLANKGDALAPLVMHARELRAHLSQLEKWAPYAEAGQVQAHWDQYGQPHGRYTSDNPNLQNRVLGVRETVEPKSGYSFVSVDWGMAEYVTWAALSKDVLLTDIFTLGRDLHSEMGVLMKSLAGADRVTDVRKFGKTTNFAILYRMKASTLAKSLGVDIEVAQAILDGYQRQAPAASKYSDAVLRKAAEDGFVETAFGRRLYCQGLKNLKGFELATLQKTVWHHHNAGTAAEMLKMKMVEVEKSLREKGITFEQAHVALNMHDEIIYEVEDSIVPKVEEITLSAMKKEVPGFLPFSVTAKTGKNWLEISK